MLLENCNAEEDGKTKYTYDDANDKQLLKPIKNSVRWWCDGDVDDGGVDDNGGNGEIKKEDDEGNKDESIFEELVQVLRDRQTASVPHGHHRWVFSITSSGR